MNHMTVHLALDEQTEANGCLTFIPGSHKWTRTVDGRPGEPLPITADDFANMESIKEVLTKEEINAFQPQPGLLEAGQVSFHHPLCVHGSFGNHSDVPRRAAVLNYCADGTISDTDEPLLEGVPVVPRGQPLGSGASNQFFPLVFQPPLDSSAST